MAPGLAMLTHKVSGFDPGLVGQGFSSLLVPRVGYLFFFSVSASIFLLQSKTCSLG